MKNMDAWTQKQIEKYKKYAETTEAFAVLFVKKYLRQANGMWIDILRADGYPGSRDRLQFRDVWCALYPKTRKPKYPEREQFLTEEDYIRACRAVTWITAREDFMGQKRIGVMGTPYHIHGVRFPYRPGQYFKPNTPPQIKALAKDLDDRTSPLWDEAQKYLRSEDGYGFKILGIKKELPKELRGIRMK